MENVLRLDSNKFISIVCIPSTAKIKIQSKSYVLRIYELNDKILSYKEKIIDNYREIYSMIHNMNIINKNKRKEHIDFVNELNSSKDKNKENCCPKCGGKLIKRSGKYGEFLGCSNYPKCKFTKKI